MSTLQRIVPILLAAGAALTSSAEAQTLDVEEIQSGMSFPVYLTSPPGDTSRLFVLEYQDGLVRIIKDGVLLPAPFLDIGSLLSPASTQGLLSMAFHPDYDNNGRFFVLYHDVQGDGVVAEYQASPTDPDVADPTQVAVIVGPILQMVFIHNLNHLAFGPDGMLYVSVGDNDRVPATTNNKSQDLQSLYGKLLRLDIDRPAPYIPPDNPFVGNPNARGEIYAYGLRQPWRFAFERGTGNLFLSDVGQAQREEVNYIPAGTLAGKNFGWPCLEGTLCTTQTHCDCLDSNLHAPIIERQHGATVTSIIGGYSYRGSDIPGLQGTYFYSDYVTSKIRTFEVVGGQAVNQMDRTADMHPGGAGFEIFGSFAEDASGEMYILGLQGSIFKIIAGDPTPPPTGSICHGDGGDQAGCIDCPCSNNNAPGLSGGCLNGSGNSALLTTSGVPSVASDTLNFDVSGATPSNLAILVSGDGLLPLQGACAPGTGILGTPPMDGLRCVGINLLRHGGRLLDSNGDSGVTTPHWGRPNPPIGGIIAQGGWIAGQSRGFQIIYRDLAQSGCGTGLNTSNAIALTFLP